MIFVVVVLGLLLFMIPLAAPAVAIIASVVIWPAVYLGIHLASQGADLTQQLPWYVADPDRATVNFVVFFTLLGIIRGIPGCIAMATVWIPFFLLPTFLLNQNVAVEHRLGWIGYVYENYDDNCSRKQCEYTPMGNRQLPTFIQRGTVGSESTDIISVIPYRTVGFQQPNNNVNNSNNCTTTVEKSETMETVTTTCYHNS